MPQDQDKTPPPSLSRRDENLEAVQAKLAAKGFNAYYYEGGSGRFSVRLDPFRSASAAEPAHQQLEALGYRGPYLSKITD